jgi:hypothetical protein
MPRIRHAVVTLGLAGGLACASEGVEAAWVDAAGQRVTDEQVAAAEEACYAEVDRELPRSSRAFDHIAWGRAMRQCMERRGLVLVAVPD